MPRTPASRSPSSPPSRKRPARGTGGPTEAVHPRGRKLHQLDGRQLVGEILDDQQAAFRAFTPKVRRGLARLAERYAETLANGDRVFYVGAGTSGRLGALDAAECPPTFGTSPDRIQAIVAGGPRALSRAVERAEDDEAAARRDLLAAGLTPRDLVVGISASGSTPYVLAALDAAKDRGAATALLCCRTPPAPVASDQVIVLGVGPEIVAGSTRLKAGTATKIALNTLSTAAHVRLGRVRDGRMVALRGTNRKLRQRAIGIVAELGSITRGEAERRLEVCDWDVARALAPTRRGRASRS